MPLSKERMRERKKLDRLNVKPTSNLSYGISVKPTPLTITSKTVNGVPFYNPAIHKPGDKVWIWQNGKQTEVIAP